MLKETVEKITSGMNTSGSDVKKEPLKEGFNLKKDFAASIINGNVIIFQIFGYFTKYPIFIKNSEIDPEIASAIKDIKNENINITGVEIVDDGLLLKYEFKELKFNILLNGDEEKISKA